MQLIISRCGTVRCVYGEEIDLLALGQVHISRASHVEPTPDGHWQADLAPVGGPLLGPFASRSTAIGAETRWLAECWPSRTGASEGSSH